MSVDTEILDLLTRRQLETEGHLDTVAIVVGAIAELLEEKGIISKDELRDKSNTLDEMATEVVRNQKLTRVK
jgi:hypothetical protein